MFNNIIYFIVVLLLFNVSLPGGSPGDIFLGTFAPSVLGWLAFFLYSDRSFRRFLWQIREGELAEGVMAERYQRINVRLSVLAILLFSANVYGFHLKDWLLMVPGFKTFSVLQGVLALALFLFYLSTIWYLGHSSYETVFRVQISRGAFIQSQLRFNLPILFPWLILSLAYDLLALTPWQAVSAFMDTIYGQVSFFAAFIVLLMAILPRFIQAWWGCRSLPAGEKADALRQFLAEKRFRYRGILTWPIFEGTMMTAGIMGIVPRYRYILITDSLMRALAPDELKAVVAHEMGHARYGHLLFYLVFFIGYMFLSFGLSDLSIYLAFLFPGWMEWMVREEARFTSLFYLMASVPMLVSLLVYFRYVMGFFMRHFEREADLYSAALMGTPVFTISSLEKIAFLGGQIRDLPSWHHFSIRQRVEYLLRFHKDPWLIRRHHRFVRISLVIYLAAVSLLGYVLHFGPVKGALRYGVVEKAIEEELLKAPQNVELYLALAMIYQEKGEEKKCAAVYEKIIELDPSRAVALNNLAWLLATASDKAMRNPKRAIELARRAVALERSAGFLDTLAEAYYAAGRMAEAIGTIEEAIAVATENRAYYEKQLRKFREASSGHGDGRRGQ